MAPYTHHSLFLVYHFVHTFVNNLKTIGHIRTFYVLNNCSTIEDVVHASSDYWGTIPNMPYHLFLMQYSALDLSASQKSDSAFNCTILRMTLLLPRIAYFHVECSKVVTTNKLRSCTCIAVSFCVQLCMTRKIRVNTTPTYYTPNNSFTANNVSFIHVSTKWTTIYNCHPEHPSTYHSVFANTMYTQKKRDNNWAWFNVCS